MAMTQGPVCPGGTNLPTDGTFTATGVTYDASVPGCSSAPAGTTYELSFFNGTAHAAGYDSPVSTDTFNKTFTGMSCDSDGAYFGSGSASGSTFSNITRPAR